ncbi:MAG TPA: ATP-binding protein [Solirubrobacterales bacterium]|nr:ATP-binding protein [Solirubrobacterales bacterium]
MSSPPRRSGHLSSVDLGDRPACKLGVCDGSGWIVGPENVARPCECRDSLVAKRRARGVSSVIPRRFRDVSFELAENDGIAPDVLDAVREFADQVEDRLDSGRGLWLMGDVGTGKTTLAMLVSKTAAEAGRTVAIYSLPRLLARIRRTYDGEPGEDSYLEFFDRLTSVDLLHIDDLGAEKRSDWVLEQLYAIVDERYQSQRSMVVTSNLDPDQLKEQIGSRVVSRLAEICRELPLWGEDRRYNRYVG